MYEEDQKGLKELIGLINVECCGEGRRERRLGDLGRWALQETQGKDA